MLKLTADLLAPGDAKSAALDPAEFSWTKIRTVTDPSFPTAYDALWQEFGAANEMERVQTLEARFQLGHAMRYEMVLVQHEEEFAAVRDHTAVWIEGEVVVHLSHVLVGEKWRRSGLAGWLRAVPILTAHEVASAHGRPEAPITLVGEMEYDDGSDPKRAIRLLAYERAGYVKVAPGIVRYHQPDFRSAEEIDASGGAVPLPFQLIVRQIGREGERTVETTRVSKWIRALYAMYGAQFRPDDMAHPALRLDHLAAAGCSLPLLPPTAP